MFILQQSGKDEEEIENQNNIKVDIMGLLFVIFFLVILIIQFTGMIVHRYVSPRVLSVVCSSSYD